MNDTSDYSVTDYSLIESTLKLRINFKMIDFN